MMVESEVATHTVVLEAYYTNSDNGRKAKRVEPLFRLRTHLRQRLQRAVTIEACSA